MEVILEIVLEVASNSTSAPNDNSDIVETTEDDVEFNISVIPRVKLASRVEVLVEEDANISTIPRDSKPLVIDWIFTDFERGSSWPNITNPAVLEEDDIELPKTSTTPSDRSIVIDVELEDVDSKLSDTPRVINDDVWEENVTEP